MLVHFGLLIFETLKATKNYKNENGKNCIQIKLKIKNISGVGFFFLILKPL